MRPRFPYCKPSLLLLLAGRTRALILFLRLPFLAAIRTSPLIQHSLAIGSRVGVDVGPLFTFRPLFLWRFAGPLADLTLLYFQSSVH